MAFRDYNIIVEITIIINHMIEYFYSFMYEKISDIAAANFKLTYYLHLNSINNISIIL